MVRAEYKNSQLFSIKKIWPTFADVKIEIEYQSDTRAKNILAVAKAILGISLFNGFFIFSDLFAKFHSASNLYGSIFIKLFIIVLGWFFFLFLKKYPTQQMMTRCILLFAVLYLSLVTFNLNLYLGGLKPPSLLEMSIPFSYATILVYIYAPVGIRMQLLLATMAFLYYILVCFWHYSINDPRLIFGLSFLLISNSIGLSICYYVNRHLRVSWAQDRQRQQDLTYLQKEIERRTRLEQELKRQALTDSLTNADNRRSFMKNLEREIAVSDRYKTSLTLIAFDVDHFKQINDNYGHDIGDAVLVSLAQHVPKMLRNTDTFARIGGEEFAIILPGANLEHGANVAKDLCSSFRDLSISAESVHLGFTCSFGVIERVDKESSQSMLKRVDINMYLAKEQGRNRVVS